MFVVPRIEGTLCEKKSDSTPTPSVRVNASVAASIATFNGSH